MSSSRPWCVREVIAIPSWPNGFKNPARFCQFSFPFATSSCADQVNHHRSHRCCHFLRVYSYQHQIHWILVITMPPKRSGAKKTSHVRPATTSRAPSCSSFEARSEHSQIAEPPEPVPDTEGQEMESTLAPSPTHHKLLLPTQRLVRIISYIVKEDTNF